MAPEDVIRRLLELDGEGERRRLLARALGAGQGERLLRLLKDESERYRYIDTSAALRLAEALIDGGRLAGRPEHEALGLMAKADALRQIGQYPQSLQLFDEAAQSFLAQGNEVGWARTRIGWLISMHRLGRAAEALPVVERAREILIRHEEWLRAAGLDLNAAVVCRELGHYDRALALFDRAQQTYEALGAAAEVRAARAKADRANLLVFLGEFRAALALHEEARAIFLRYGETGSVLREDVNRAYVYAGQGHYTRALRLLGDVLDTAEQSGLEADGAQAALDMVECYLRLNRHAEALELAEEAVARFERLGTPTEAARARFLCALAQARLGDPDRALEMLGEAGEVFARTGLAGQLAHVALQRAILYLGEQDWAQARQEAARAQALFAERGEAVLRAQAGIVVARACLALGHVEEAVRQAQEALAVAGEQGVLWLTHEAHHVLAGAARARGDLQQALSQYDAAMASIDRAQSALAIELRSNFLEDKLAVYHEAIDCSLRLGRLDAAFAYLERAKSRALVDYLARTMDIRLRAAREADQPLVDELARLREEHNWFYSQLYGSGLDPQSESRRSHAELDVLRAAVRDRERRIARLLERLALRSSEAQEGLLPPPPEQFAPPRLDERTVLLEYCFGPSGATVFVVTSEGLTAVALPGAEREVHRLLNLGQLSLDAAARAVEAGHSLAGLERNLRGILEALYRALLQPVAGHLAGRERLVVVPSGLAHYVPFHALFDGRRYLLETLEVSVCPSSSLLRLCTERARRLGHRSGGQPSALVIAYSGGGRLPFVVEEAQAVAALLPGACYLEEQATRAALAEAPRHDVLHLAAHGEARLDNPAFAHLRLADGQLTVVDVFNLDLRGALVTLSACETGRSVVQAGDELIGLSRGFLYAGASTLVQSLWRVEDGSTARLMERFYRALRAGQTKGAALRAAQLSLLAGEASHPYFWAPFQLVGDGG
jgi:CHAT domain-containing protein